MPENRCNTPASDWLMTLLAVVTIATSMTLATATVVSLNINWWVTTVALIACAVGLFVGGVRLRRRGR